MFYEDNLKTSGFFFNNLIIHYFLLLRNAVVNIAGEFQ